MRKLGSVILIMLMSLTLSSCTTTEEKALMAAFQDLDLENEVLYFDASYNHFIDELEITNTYDRNISFDWIKLFVQNTKLNDIMQNHEVNNYIDIDFSKLQEDIKNSVTTEFTSEITIICTVNNKEVSKTIDVLYYDLYSQYRNLYGSSYKEYVMELKEAGYYSLVFPNGPKMEKYISHVEDPVSFERQNLKIEVKEKYLGYEFVVHEGDELVFKSYRSDKTRYSFYFDDDYYAVVDNNIYFIESIDDVKDVTVMVSLTNPSNIKLDYDLDGATHTVNQQLKLHEKYTDNTSMYLDVEYELTDHRILEIRFEKERMIIVRRIILEE